MTALKAFRGALGLLDVGLEALDAFKVRICLLICTFTQLFLPLPDCVLLRSILQLRLARVVPVD